MTDLFTVQIDHKLITEASRIADEIGTTPEEIVRVLFKQMVRRGAVPFPLQTDAPEDEVLSPANRRNEMADQF